MFIQKEIKIPQFWSEKDLSAVFENDMFNYNL